MKKLVVALDSAFYLAQETKRLPIPCPICDGSGETKIKNKVFVCPQCDGSGRILGKTESEWTVRGPVTLNSVHLRCRNGEIEEEFMYDVMYPLSKSMVSVSIDKTNLFETLDEAMAEAMRRNLNACSTEQMEKRCSE